MAQSSNSNYFTFNVGTKIGSYYVAFSPSLGLNYSFVKPKLTVGVRRDYSFRQWYINQASYQVQFLAQSYLDITKDFSNKFSAGLFYGWISNSNDWLVLNSQLGYPVWGPELQTKYRGLIFQARVDIPIYKNRNHPIIPSLSILYSLKLHSS